MVRAYTNELLILCIVTTMLGAQGTSLQAATQTVGMTPAAVAFAAWGGVEIKLWQVDPLKRRLVFDIRGRETTRVPATAPLRFDFDVGIVRVELLEVSRTMRVDSLIVDQTAMFTMMRDPFVPPQAWQCLVMIELTTLPNTGHMRVGADDIQPVTYALTPAMPGVEPPANRL